MFKNINIIRGLKRIYIVICIFYFLLLFIFFKIAVNENKIESHFFVTELSCKESIELAKERKLKVKNGEPELSSDKSLFEFNDFIIKNANFDISFNDNNVFGCYAEIKRSWQEMYYDIFIGVLIVGVLPATILYLIASFIIKGFRKQ